MICILCNQGPCSTKHGLYVLYLRLHNCLLYCSTDKSQNFFEDRVLVRLVIIVVTSYQKESNGLAIYNKSIHVTEEKTATLMHIDIVFETGLDLQNNSS